MTREDAIKLALEGTMIIESAEYYRNKMHDCLDLAAQANHPSMKAAWLLVAEQLEKLAANIETDRRQFD